MIDFAREITQLDDLPPAGALTPSKRTARGTEDNDLDIGRPEQVGLIFSRHPAVPRLAHQGRGPDCQPTH